MNDSNKNIHTASGAYKRKLKKLKEENHLKLLKTNSKIESFFKNTSVDSCQHTQNEDYAVTDVQIPSSNTSAAVEEITDVSSDLTSPTSPNVSSPQSTIAQLERDSTSSQNSQHEHFAVTDFQIPSTSGSAAVEEITDDSSDLTSRNVSNTQPAMPQSTLTLNVLDPSSWDNLSVHSTDFVIRNLPKHLLAIKDCDFSKSKRHYPDKVRTVKEHMLFSRLPNGELKKREWLMYSNTTGCLYCVPCKLFHSHKDSSFCKGFNDWKHSNRLKEHEQSSEHRLNMKTFVL